MNVFISWSGERSRQVAELLKQWLQCVIQSVEPWVSSEDIDRGALWFNEISDQLANTNTGIVCLTKENINKPWILFEAGALAKGLSSNRVFTFLIDLKPTDIQDPLAQFNHTEPTKEGIKKLLSTINKSSKGKVLNSPILDSVFETFYPKFEEEFKEIIKNTKEAPIEEKRKPDDILLEILSSTRELEKRMRRIEVETDQKTQTEVSFPIESVENGSGEIYRRQIFYTDKHGNKRALKSKTGTAWAFIPKKDS